MSFVSYLSSFLSQKCFDVEHGTFVGVEALGVEYAKVMVHDLHRPWEITQVAASQEDYAEDDKRKDKGTSVRLNRTRVSHLSCGTYEVLSYVFDAMLFNGHFKSCHLCHFGRHDAVVMLATTVCETGYKLVSYYN